MGSNPVRVKMKILYICSADLSGECGSLGSVRHIMEVSENLCTLGHKVTLVAPDYARYAHPTPVKIRYVPIIKRRFLRTLSFELLAPFYIIACILTQKPHAIYWRQAYLTIFPVLLARIFGKPIVTEINGLTRDELETEPLSRLRKNAILLFERFNYSRSTHLISVAPQIKEEVCAQYNLPAAKVSVILNGVNHGRMPAIDAGEAKIEIGIDPNCLVVGFVGHFFAWDGIEFLIEAASKIILGVPSVRFLVVGHGKWGRHLPGLVQARRLEKHFIFTGKVPWERLYLYVNAMDVATAPYAQAINTQSGRSSLKILEYFACCKPVVASRTRVIPEIVDIEEKQLGLTVPAEDPESLAEAILRLLKDESLRQRMGDGGRDYVVNGRSWFHVAVQTQAILRKSTGRAT
jgi:glycosyltransferase involved in cell wall biosynthesis